MGNFTEGGMIRREWKKPVAAIFIHAGAGYHSTTNEKVHLQACNDAARIAMRCLKNGGTATVAVELAIKCLEDREITNAGFGSNLNMDGAVEGDATVVDHLGRSGACGAVPGIKNPISLAKVILDTSSQRLSLRRVPPNILVGYGAQVFAEQHGIRTVRNEELVSKNAQDRYERWWVDLQRAEARIKAAGQFASNEGRAPTPGGYEAAALPVPAVPKRDHTAAILTATWNEGQPDSPYHSRPPSEYVSAQSSAATSNRATPTLQPSPPANPNLGPRSPHNVNFVPAVPTRCSRSASFSTNRVHPRHTDEPTDNDPLSSPSGPPEKRTKTVGAHDSGMSEDSNEYSQPMYSFEVDQEQQPIYSTQDNAEYQPIYSADDNQVYQEHQPGYPAPASQEHHPHHPASTSQENHPIYPASPPGWPPVSLPPSLKPKLLLIMSQYADVDLDPAGPPPPSFLASEAARSPSPPPFPCACCPGQCRLQPVVDHCEYFRRRQLFMASHTDEQRTFDDRDVINDTVGAIAIDLQGHMAAGSSSGGIGMKHRGRVGPAALVGVGTAVIPSSPGDPDDVSVAAVTSGTGEHMATTMASYKCAERLYHGTRRGPDGRDVAEDDEDSIMESFVREDFMGHPGVRNQPSAGAIGVMAVKKARGGYYFFFAHNTDSFALASQSSEERAPLCVMSRTPESEKVIRGGRKVRVH